MKKKGSIDDLGAIVGQNVRIYRAASRMSQEALAEQCGIKRSYVGSIERAEIDVRLTTLAKLAQGLGIEPFRLLIDARDQLKSKR